MTRCSWKTGLIVLAGTFLITFSGSAYAADVMEYSGNNKAVKEKVDEFNRQLSLVSKEDASELVKEQAKKQEECDLLNKKIYSMTNSWWSVGNNIRNWGFEADDNFFSRIGNALDAGVEGLEALWSSNENNAKDLSAQLDYFHSAAMSHAKTPERKTEIQQQYNEFKQIVDEINTIVEKMKSVCGASKALRGVNTNDDIYKYVDPKNGAEFLFVKEKDGTLKTVGGVTNGCIPLPAKLAESRSCIFCPLFKTVFNAAQSMTTKSYSALAQAISNVLLIGFALWVAFSLLGKVSSFTKMDAPKYITELVTQAFKVLVAYLLLRDATTLYVYLIGPLLKAGMEFGMTLLYTNGNEYLSSCDSNSALQGTTGGMLPGYLYVQLECFIQAVQAELAVPQSIGSSLMCVAQNAGSSDISAFGLVTVFRLPDFAMLFQGLIIWAFAWLISLAFAFYLIDATVRLGIVGALMPFLIACWPFKLTSKYTTQGFTMFMNTFFTYVFMGLVISVNIQLMGQSLTGTKGGFEAIENALNSDQVSVLQDLLNIGFAGFLILIASCIFGFKLTAQATELAGTMAGGGGGQSIAPQIGGMAANVAKAGTLGAAQKGWQGTKFLGNATGITPKARKVRDQALGWVGKKLGFGGSSGGGAPSSGGAPRPAPAPTPTPAPTSTPPATPSQQQQAEQVQNAAPRPAPVPDSGPTPAPTSTHSEQAPKPTPAPTPTHSEQAPKPTPALTPAEMRSKALKEFETSDAGKAINQAISNQTSRRAEHRQKLDSLRDDRRRASDDVRFFENAARDTKASQDFRDNMRKEANAARQRERAFENEIKAEQAEIKKCDDSLNSLNQLKGNTAEQYTNNKVDPKNNQEVNTAEIVNQVNNMTI